MVKPIPEIVAELKVKFEFPLLVIVTFWLLDCPTGTLLKLSDAGDIAMTARVPVPLRGIDNGLFVALLVMVTLAPLTAPGVVGANFTVRVADCPGVS